MSQLLLPKVRRKPLGDLLEARLVALPGPTPVTVYRGEVTAAGRRPQIDGDTGPHPPLALDAAGQPDRSGRVAPYVVLFDGSGTTQLEPDLAYANEDLRWTPTITIAAGFSQDCAQTIDRVCAWIYRWQPVITGLSTGFLEPPDGFDPGTPRPDIKAAPIRYFVSTSWQLDVTA